MRVFYALLFGIAMTGGTSLAAGVHPNGSASALDAGARGSVHSLAQPNASHGYKVVYAFKGGTTDGEYPYAGLTALNGALYGTTLLGGATPSGGDGTIFELSASGTESVLYDFKGNPDAMLPQSGLIAVNGTLYGTTELGGAPNLGTIFKITP